MGTLTCYVELKSKPAKNGWDLIADISFEDPIGPHPKRYSMFS